MRFGDKLLAVSVEWAVGIIEVAFSELAVDAITRQVSDAFRLQRNYTVSLCRCSLVSACGRVRWLKTGTDMGLFWLQCDCRNIAARHKLPELRAATKIAL
jgi:hypothetical protein